jgi:hypothetical protein
MLAFIIAVLVGVVVAGAVYYAWSWVENAEARARARREAESADEP